MGIVLMHDNNNNKNSADPPISLAEQARMTDAQLCVNESKNNNVFCVNLPVELLSTCMHDKN